MRLFPDLNQDQEFNSLADQGYAGTMDDKQKAYLSNAGLSGTISDMKAAWYKGNLFSSTSKFFLDFINGYYRSNNVQSTLAGTTTFARSGNATMFDSDGALKWAPHNLVRHSEDAASANHGRVSVVSNDVAGPGQATLADKITQSAGQTAGGYVGAVTTSDIAPGVQNSFRAVVKNGTTDFLRVAFNASAGSGSVWFNLITGAVGTVDTGTSSQSITSLGDGWYELLVTVLSASNFFLPYLCNADNTSNATPGEFYYLYSRSTFRSDLGGMVNNPATNDSYVPTVASAVYLPREGSHLYEGGAWVNNGLQLESEARTNLLSYSQDFLNASWVALNAATLTATETGPDGVSGSAYLYKDNSAGGTGQVYLYTDIGGLATSTSHTYSCFLKADQLSWAFLEINNFTTPVNSEAWFDLSNGVVGTVDAGFDQAFIEDVGDGWYRCSVSFTTDTSDTAGRLLIRVADADADTTVDLDGTSSILIYGAQFELGSTPSSYIPTAGSTVTRAAETLTASAANLPWPTPVETTGIELVTNGDFATNDLTGFTTTITGTGSVDASTGAAVITATDGSNKGVLKWTGVGVPLGPLVLTFDVTEQTYVVATSGLSGFSNTNYNAGTTVVTVIATSSTPSLTFENAGSNGNTAVDNISVKEINPLSVSIQISGKMTYADDNSFYTFIEWSLTASNYISLTHDWRGALTGRTRFLQFAGGVGDFVEQTTAYPPGLNVPFNLASRHGSTFINGAIDGTALTANTTPVALPDLESTDLEIAPIFMGHINKFGVWDVDIGDSGIVREST